MHSLRSKRGLIAAVALALGIALALPSTASAGPETGAKRGQGRGFRLFARPLGAITINRVYLGLSNQGLVGVDSTNSSTIGGGFWPKGTPNQYVFNSGLQIAGIIQGSKPANPWGGDTTGGFFFDPKGTTEHGVGLTDIYNATNPADVANWPQGAFVPQGDVSEEIFNPLLRGRVSASQGDVWFVAWEGDPGLNAGRSHPLGIVAEYRGLGWNYPAGNEDIVYFIVTFYNITSRNAADYAQYRPGIREILVDASQQFHSLNNARFGITLPTGGYTIGPMYSAFAADMDVANAGANFASVNLPFAIGYTYESDFTRPTGWQFDPAIFGAPFFSGSGFVGIKYLKGPDGPGVIQLYGNTTNGGAFSDAANVTRLFRYLKGDVLTSAGDPQCNNGDPRITRICYIAPATPFDVRHFQSSTALQLAPGGSGSIVVAYVHAAPVAIAGYVPGTRVVPGDATRLTDPARLSLGANRIDSLTGFRGWVDRNADNIVDQTEFSVVPRSLLGKSLVAQSVFDGKFLLPFSPESPEFFLIPGNNQVTVLWKPSRTETDGDAFFELTRAATITPPGGGAPVVNPLYDANYRQFDVEGYRIYRGRIDSPSSLRLIAQFDYSGTKFRDFTGQVIIAYDPAHPAEPFTLGNCAPDLGLYAGCPVAFENVGPGTPRTVFINREINDPLVQVPIGGRTRLFSGDVFITQADTVVTGGNSGFPALSNTGVPFVFIDNDVRNGLTYYYAVTAFDVNSISSGPTSLESPRTTQRVTPGVTAGNYENSATITTGVIGRNGVRTDKVVPTIDPLTGKFSKRFPVATGLSVGLAGFVRELLSAPGEVSLRLDSIGLGTQAAASSQNAIRYFTVTTPNGTTNLSIPVTMSATSGTTASAGSFTAITADPALTARYGGSPGYTIAGSYEDVVNGGYYTGVLPRGAVNSAPGFGGSPNGFLNGPRWFIGDNETKDHPNAGNPGTFATGFVTTNFNNSGALTGVVTVHRPVSYQDRGSLWRNFEAAASPFVGAADYRVYWGAAGKIDSVIDLTHDVVVPFRARAGASWGILNGSDVPAAQSRDQRAALTASDIGCVAPFKTEAQTQSSSVAICGGAAVSFVQTAVPGPIVLNHSNANGDTGPNSDLFAPVAANNGFGLYLHGRWFIIELAGGAVPAAGTQWTMRDYIGAIRGGTGTAGSFGNYIFTPQTFIPAGSQAEQALFQFTAVGAKVSYQFDVVNRVNPSTQETLARIHTVPDPYYVTSAFETTTNSKIIKFVNLPETATVRIYTASGVLVRVLKQATTSFEGELTWDVRNRNNQFVASGVYFYHVEAENGETTVGRMTIVNYVQ